MLNIVMSLLDRMDRRKLYTLWTTALSIGVALLLLAIIPPNPWLRVVVVIGIMIAGQSLRYYLIQRYENKGKPKGIKKKDMDREVTEYFQEHPDVAKRFLRMDELGHKGNYHDAILLLNALKKEDLSPIVRKYVDYKITQFKKLARPGS